MTMIKLTDLLKEVSIVYGQTTYYAVFNYLGDYNNGIPLYIITTSKKSMVDKLNKAYKELTGENYIPYDLNDMEHPFIDHYINDDWATVTDSKKEFDRYIDLYTNLHGAPPKKYE